MKEKIEHRKKETKNKSEEKYYTLIEKAKEGPQYLTKEEYKDLQTLGYRYLKDEKYLSLAVKIFCTLQDFEGLQKIKEYLINQQQESYYLPIVLTYLEDHEGIRDLLNKTDIQFAPAIYENAFQPLNQYIYEYIKHFLKENNFRKATGLINEGIDIIAIKNLSKAFDVSIPIARGGLNQGAIAHLLGMPTKIVDIKTQNKKVTKIKWVGKIAESELYEKNILIFDKDAVSGTTLKTLLSLLEQFHPKRIGIYFAHPVLNPNELGIGTKIENLPKNIEIFSPHNAPLQNAGDTYIEVHEILKTPYGQRRILEKEFTTIAETIKEQSPFLANELQKFIQKQLEIFDAINHHLLGADEVRNQILQRIKSIYEKCSNIIAVPPYDQKELENIIKLIQNTETLPLAFLLPIITAYSENKNAMKDINKTFLTIESLEKYLQSKNLKLFKKAISL